MLRRKWRNGTLQRAASHLAARCYPFGWICGCRQHLEQKRGDCGRGSNGESKRCSVGSNSAAANAAIVETSYYSLLYGLLPLSSTIAERFLYLSFPGERENSLLHNPPRLSTCLLLFASSSLLRTSRLNILCRWTGYSFPIPKASYAVRLGPFASLQADAQGDQHPLYQLVGPLTLCIAFGTLLQDNIPSSQQPLQTPRSQISATDNSSIPFLGFLQKT